MRATKALGTGLMMAAVWTGVWAGDVGAGAQEKAKGNEKVVVEGKPEVTAAAAEPDSSTDHAVTVGGQKIAYTAVAGTITVGYSDGFDAMLGMDGKVLANAGMNPIDEKKPEEAPATARMFYTAYFRKDAGLSRGR